MKRRFPRALGVAALLLAPAAAGPLMLNGRARAPVVTGCVSCSACVASLTVTPVPMLDGRPCLFLTARACSLGGEVLQVRNACLAPLSLTSPYFEPAAPSDGSAGFDGSLTPSQDNVPSLGFGEFIATPSAERLTTLTLTGTLGGVFETVTLVVGAECKADAGQLTDARAAKDARTGSDARPRAEGGD